MAEVRDGVEVIWAYRPDDRAKQGTSEFLPADVAKMKVQEGLARYPRDGEGSKADPAASEGAVADVEVDEAETVPPETVVTDARSKRSTKTAPVPTED